MTHAWSGHRRRLPAQDHGTAAPWPASAPDERRATPAASRPATIARGVLAFAVLGLTLVVAEPLGRLRGPLVLVAALPPFAAALDAMGWSRRGAAMVGRLRSPLARALAAYVAWLATSALLTLDVAAVAAGSVGMSLGGDDAERDTQLGSAVLGSNVGSMLFPFSNLTNLIVLSGAGIGFGAYLRAAFVPQVAAAVAVAALLARRSRARLAAGGAAGAETAATRHPVQRRQAGRSAAIAGAVAVAGSAAAIGVGFEGGDVAAVLTLTSAAVVALAVASGHLGLREAAQTVPAAGIGVIVGAAALAGPMGAVAAALPSPASIPEPLGLLAVAAVGGVLAALANNLPAAAFGAVWLAGSGVAPVVAYLVGTNIGALATPHGSLATMLCRSAAAARGHRVPARTYLRSAWRFAIVGSLAALIGLIALG